MYDVPLAKASDNGYYKEMLNVVIFNSISDVHYQDYFGFTEAEVEKLLADAGFSGALPEVKRWYDGYRFGNREFP